MATAPAIETSGLSKTYGGRVRALSELDLRVERGEVFGYLGPNGAGKSTTIRIPARPDPPDGRRRLAARPRLPAPRGAGAALVERRDLELP